MMKITTLNVLSGFLWLAGSGSALKAQVSLYNYSESVEPYVEISEADGGYGLGVATFSPVLHNLRAWANNEYFAPDGQVTNAGYLGPAIGPGYEIGFDFRYNGDVFDRIGVAHGGWISFGKSSDGNRSVVIFTSSHPAGRPLSHSFWQPAPSTNRPDHDYQRNRIAGWGNSDLYMRDNSQLIPPGTVSSLRVATVGTAPNRVCVIQWKDFLSGYPPKDSRLNFQIRLYETTNVVEVRFGPTVWRDLVAYVQVGLGGRTNEDFNNRKTVYEQPAFLHDWNITVAGETNEDYCYAISEQPGRPNDSGIKPVEGRTFRWTPDACPPPAWPLTVSNIAFDGAQASWEPTGSGTYDYFVSKENDINGSEAASGTVTDAEAYIEGLEPSTTYYIFVRSHCDGEPGAWGLGTPFVTHGGGYLSCPGAPMEVDFCANAQNATFYWSYVSEDGFSPIKIDFSQGTVGSENTAFGIWNGSEAVGDPAFSATGELAGRTFTSTSPQITIRLMTDLGSCGPESWYLPLQWRVGCKNCEDPLVTFVMLEPDCENNEFFVDVDVFSMGSATTLSLLNTLGVAATEATAADIYTVGPFPAGSSVVLTAENTENPICYFSNSSLISLPCAMEDCGPTEYTLCYGDNDWFRRAYRGANDQEMGIRFLSGAMGIGDRGKIYNGADPEEASSVDLPAFTGALLNNLYTSGAPSTDRTLVLELAADNSHSCQDEDPLYGTSPEIRYVVACYDGCTQPRATSVSNCLTQTQYEVAVTLTDLGSTGSVTLTNNGGAPSVTVTELGTYAVGPFAAGTPVTIEVEGASVLCTWTLNVSSPDCSRVGIGELEAGQLSLYPNPTSGIFRVELPVGMTGLTELQVLDLAGRVVNRHMANTSSGITMDLGHLPTGLYTVLAQGGSKRSTARVSIQH